MTPPKHAFNPGVYGEEPVQFYFINATFSDRTAAFYDLHIRQALLQAVELFEEYADAVDDFCSTNLLDKMNDFFITAIEEKYADTLKPWQVGASMYVYMSSLLDVSWNEDKTQRDREKVINIENCNSLILNLLTEVVPQTGNRFSVARLARLLRNLYNEHFADTPESTVGKTDIYSFNSGLEPIVAAADDVVISIQERLPTEIIPTAEMIIAKEEPEEEDEEEDTQDTGGTGGGGSPGQGTRGAGYPIVIFDIFDTFDEEDFGTDTGLVYTVDQIGSGFSGDGEGREVGIPPSDGKPTPGKL